MRWLSTQKKILTYIWYCLHFALQVSFPFCFIVFTECYPCFCLLNLIYHTSWSFCCSSEMRSQPLPLLFISVISLLGVLDFLIVLAYFGQYSFNNCCWKLVHSIFWNVFKTGNSVLWVWMHVSSLFRLFPTCKNIYTINMFLFLQELVSYSCTLRQVFLKLLVSYFALSKNVRRLCCFCCSVALLLIC